MMVFHARLSCVMAWGHVNLFLTKGKSSRRSSKKLEDTRRVCKILRFIKEKDYYSETKKVNNHRYVY